MYCLLSKYAFGTLRLSGLTVKVILNALNFLYRLRDDLNITLDRETGLNEQQKLLDKSRCDVEELLSRTADEKNIIEEKLRQEEEKTRYKRVSWQISF